MFRLVPLHSAERSRLNTAKKSSELFGVLENAPEVSEMAIEVVRHLADSFRVIRQHDTPAAEKRFDIMKPAGIVWLRRVWGLASRRHQSHDLLRQVALAAVPLQRAVDLQHG